MKEDQTNQPPQTHTSASEAGILELIEKAALARVPAGASEMSSEELPTNELTVNERVTGYLKLSELAAARITHLDSVEWRIGYAIWTIIALAIAANLSGKKIPIWCAVLAAIAAIVVHGCALHFLYESQLRNRDLWRAYIGQIHEYLGVLDAKQTSSGETSDWLGWFALQVGVSIILGVVLAVISVG